MLGNELIWVIIASISVLLCKMKLIFTFHKRWKFYLLIKRLAALLRGVHYNQSPIRTYFLIYRYLKINHMFHTWYVLKMTLRLYNRRRNVVRFDNKSKYARQIQHQSWTGESTEVLYPSNILYFACRKYPVGILDEMGNSYWNFIKYKICMRFNVSTTLKISMLVFWVV